MTIPTHQAVSHTLSPAQVRRLARIAYRGGISRSSILEHALNRLFALFPNDKDLTQHLLDAGATRKRRHTT